jgi:hypothetical protein
MSKINGIVNGIFIYHEQEIMRVKCESGTEVYVDRDLHQVIVKDERDLQTKAVIIDGELKSPWQGI